MTNPFNIAGWNLNRYMVSTSVAGVSTLFALLLPATALAGWPGPKGVAAGGYGVLAFAVVAQLCRLGASNLKRSGARRVCLTVLEAVLWGMAALSVPVLAFDLMGLATSGHAGSGDGGRHAFAVAATVFGAIAVAAGINLTLLLRSPLWMSFRAFALEDRDADAPSPSRSR